MFKFFFFKIYTNCIKDIKTCSKCLISSERGQNGWRPSFKISDSGILKVSFWNFKISASGKFKISLSEFFLTDQKKTSRKDIIHMQRKISRSGYHRVMQHIHWSSSRWKKMATGNVWPQGLILDTGVFSRIYLEYLGSDLFEEYLRSDLFEEGAEGDARCWLLPLGPAGQAAA